MRRTLVSMVSALSILLSVMSGQAQSGKPTPTPLPPATPRFDIPESYSLWAGTDYAVQSWNIAGDIRAIFQAVILIGLVIAGLFLFTRFIRELSRKDAEE